MNYLFVDPFWTYKEAVSNIRALRREYEEVLALFLYDDCKGRAKFIRSTRAQFYALKLTEWQRDNLWEYMTRYKNYSQLKQSAARYK
jgi:hypothetical protein